MDLALVRRAGQELRNTYTITGSPDFTPLRRFFNVAINQLQLLYNDLPVTPFQPTMPAAQSLIDTMRAAIDSCDASSEDSLLLLSPVKDLQIAASPVISSSSF